MFTHNYEILAKIHQEELLKEAQQYRLIQQARDGQESQDQVPSQNFVRQAVAWIGDHMISTGNHLKNHVQPGLLRQARG